MSPDDPYALDRSVMMHGLSQMQRVALEYPKFRRELGNAYAESVLKALTDIQQISAPKTLKGLEFGRQLSESGLAELGQVLSPTQTSETLAYFKTRPVYPSHVAALAKEPPGTIESIRGREHYGAYDVADVLAAPHLLELANHPDLLSAAAAYLGCVPSLYSVNCWWTFGGHSTAAPVAHRLHRDPDDLRFCTLFVYLTDVEPDAGPHIYVTDTHDCERFDPELIKRLANAGIGASEAQILLNSTYQNDGNEGPLDTIIALALPERVRQLTGKAGSALLEDTYGLHKGTSLSKTDRLMFWARYGLGPNYAYDCDKTRPRAVEWRDRLPDSPLTRYVNRLVIDTR